MTSTLYTVAQAAAAIGASVAWVRREAASVGAQRVGRDWIITAAQVESLRGKVKPVGRPRKMIEMVRSDMGDGGWSLHPVGYSDDDYADGTAPLLLSGDAEMVDGEWDRPNEADYEAAREALEKIK